MESVSGLLGIVTLKRILAGRSCDFVDRLHHKVTVLLLIVFAAVVSAKQFVAEPIHCWVPAEYIHVWQLKYVNYQCWVQNKYFVAFDDEIPGSIDEIKETDIAYYIWVPLILLLLSFLFLVPHLIYRALCSYAGVNLNRIAALADEYVCAKKETRKKVIEDLGIFLDRWLSYENRRSGLLGIVTLKKILAGRSCDFVDRLHHKVTVLLLIVFAAVVSAKQFVAEPIHCWVPAEYIHVWQLKYVNYQCWVQNKYFVAFDDEIPGSIDERKETEIAYYIWVPLILLLLSFLFLVPHLIYRALCSYAGVNLNRIAALADEYVCAKKETREKVIEDLGIFLDRWLSFENRRRDLYRCSRLNSRYLAIVYMTTKVLYLTNLLLVVIILNDFLDMDFYAYGIDVIYGLRDNVRERESPRFPRVTLCDLQIRQLQNEQTHTVQCVLPINLLNEKIFVLLWFWFILLGIVTIINLAKWLYIFIWANNKYNFIRKHLILHNSIPPKEINKKLCRNFAENYIGDNGCFLFRMMSLNCSDLVVNDVVDHLWTKFEERRKQKNDC